MNKKIFFVVLCLALASLACLQTGGVITEPVELATVAPVLEIVEESAVVDVQQVMPSPTAAEVCAVVVADEAVNLRSVAAASDIVLTWLERDDLVRVLDSSNAEWWRVSFAGLEGFVRSAYLQVVRCEDVDR